MEELQERYVHLWNVMFDIEKNAEMAKKILGYPVKDVWKLTEEETKYLQRNENGELPYFAMYRDNKWQNIPDYIHDIKHAWEIVEKLTGLDRSIKFERKGDLWKIELKSKKHIIQYYDKNISEAICAVAFFEYYETTKEQIETLEEFIEKLKKEKGYGNGGGTCS